MREIEIKLRVGDPDEARAAFGRAGAVPRTSRQFEDNRLYDDDAGTLRSGGKLLRIRSIGGRHLVTLKTPPEGEPSESGRYKIRTEYETVIGDADEFARVLGGLGYRQTYRYQKYRQSYVLAGVKAELDETPLGVFIELEGPERAIDGAAATLGFEPADFLNKTYRQIHEEYAGTAEPGDLVFPGGAPGE